LLFTIKFSIKFIIASILSLCVNKDPGNFVSTPNSYIG